jgi:hypothetical protein
MDHLKTRLVDYSDVHCNALTTQEACTDYSKHLNTGLVGYLNGPFWSKHLNNKLTWYSNSHTRTQNVLISNGLKYHSNANLNIRKFVQYSNGC